MSQGIEGKVVLITGGGTGIGAEVACLLAAKGARIAVAARRQDKLEEVVSQIASAGGAAAAYVLDVTDKKQVKAVVDSVISKFGRLDVIINNAGLMPIRPMAEVNTDEWDTMIDVNIKGLCMGSRLRCPSSLPRKAATSSTWAPSPAPRFLLQGALSIPGPSSPCGPYPRDFDKKLENTSASPRLSPARWRVI